MSRRRRDRGAGPVSTIMVMAILAMSFTCGFAALGASASDERAGAQHAADAAALAGAGEVMHASSVPLTRPGFLAPGAIYQVIGASACSPLGAAQAQALASANAAGVVHYCWNAYTDTVQVSVRMVRTATPGTPATASATARTTFQPGQCSIDPVFLATVATLPPVPAVSTWMRCSGRTKVLLQYDPTTKLYVLGDGAAFVDAFDVRLVS